MKNQFLKLIKKIIFQFKLKREVYFPELFRWSLGVKNPMNLFLLVEIFKTSLSQELKSMNFIPNERII